MIKFILAQSQKTDIFCFLEVHPELEEKLESALPGFRPVYSKGIRVAYLDKIIEGRSIFVKNNIKLIKTGKISLYKTTPIDAGGFQYIEIAVNDKKIMIGSAHGKARPGNKLDTPIRLKQSEKIINLFAAKKGAKIIGGDFNLMPGTKSIKMFEEAGYKNLIKDFNIRRTRNKIAWSQFRGSPNFIKQYFADYIFISPEIKTKKFEVPEIEVSDHLPLILDFEI